MRRRTHIHDGTVRHLEVYAGGDGSGEYHQREQGAVGALRQGGAVDVPDGKLQLEVRRGCVAGGRCEIQLDGGVRDKKQEWVGWVV
jgi:hypothetical protein